MKKSFIAASLLFALDSFAVGDQQLTTTSAGCGSYTTPPYFWQRTTGANRNDPCDWYASSTLQPPNGTKTTFCRTGAYDTWIQIGTNTSNGSGTCNVVWQEYRPVSSCGSSLNDSDNDGICEPTCPSGQTFNEVTYTCVIPPLSAFNNNPSGCASAGGYYFNDGKCVDGTDAIAKVFTDPTAIVGGLIFINGAAWSIAGAYALPITGGASSAAIAYGGHAMVAGLATLGVSALGQLYNQPDSVTPKSDSTTGETRIKVKLQSDNSTTVAQGDISSGKVESISYIPPEVKQRILEGVVNPTTGLPNITQSDLAGTTVTKYNYSTNTATTETIKTDGTTVTSTTPITPISNPDGTVTAQSHNEAIAPTVTGTKSSTWAAVPEWNQYQTIAQWTETIKTNSGTGSTSGGGTTGTIPVNTGDATADAIVNAQMPSYSIGDVGSFDTYDRTVVDDMHSTTYGFLDNIQNQIDAAQTVYDQTSALISGGWQPPQIPAGECGTAMTMDFHGKHIDVCPSLANFLAPISPLVSFLITIAGTSFAIAIFIGGF